jgi:hypothetical protein
MIKKLRNQPYVPKWEQEEEEKNLTLNFTFICVQVFFCLLGLPLASLIRIIA